MINGVGGAADVVVAVVAGVGVRRAASNANYLFRFADSAKHHVIWRHLRTTTSNEHQKLFSSQREFVRDPLLASVRQYV